MHADSRILHRQLRGQYPVAVSGDGCWITDASGKRYLDASGGAAVSCLGHVHPDVLAAMHAQIDALAYAHTSFFSTAIAEELADALIRGAPAGISHVYLVSGGSEAVERTRSSDGTTIDVTSSRNRTAPRKYAMTSVVVSV